MIVVAKSEVAGALSDDIKSELGLDDILIAEETLVSMPTFV